MRTEELTLPGFRHDVCSAIHPLGRSSAFFRELELDVEWLESPACARASVRRRGGGAARAERRRDGGGARRGRGRVPRAVGPLARAGVRSSRCCSRRFRSTRGAVRALRELGARLAARAARRALAGRGVAERTFSTRRGRALFAGNAAHSMLPLERRPSAGFALALLTLGHAVGWPFPRGGSQALADALAARLRELGGEIRHVVAGRRAAARRRRALRRVAARAAAHRDASRRLRARCAATATGPARSSSTGRSRARSRGATSAAPQAATVHLGGTLDEIAASERAPRTASRPPVRAARAAEPLGRDARAGRAAHGVGVLPRAERLDGGHDRRDRGAGRAVRARASASASSRAARAGPRELEAHNRNLVGGDLNGGADGPAPALHASGRAARPVPDAAPGVYLCSRRRRPAAACTACAASPRRRSRSRDLRRSTEQGRCHRSAGMRQRRRVDDLEVRARDPAERVQVVVRPASGSGRR